MKKCCYNTTRKELHELVNKILGRINNLRKQKNEWEKEWKKEKKKSQQSQ